MSAPSEFDSRIDVLDILINALKEHERNLMSIVERIETIFEKVPISSGDSESPDKWEESRWTLERGREREGIIFVSGKKILLIPEEELPKLLRSKPVTLAEYELDTPEKRSALERLFAMLERRKRSGK